MQKKHAWFQCRILLQKTMLGVFDILLTFNTTLALVIWAALAVACAVRITVTLPASLKGFATPPFTRVTWYTDTVRHTVHPLSHQSPPGYVITHA
jgi:hypothetical protein